MSETIQHDKWLNDYLGLVVPPPPRPPQALGERLKDVEALQRLAAQLAASQSELAKLVHKERAEQEAINLLVEMIGDEFDHVIDLVEADKKITNKAEICESLEKDRATFANPFPPSFQYEGPPDLGNSLFIAVNKLLTSLEDSTSASDQLRAEQRELRQHRIRVITNEIEPYTAHKVDGIARTARALVASTDDGQPAASTTALDTMLRSRKETPVVVWIDSAETEKFDTGLSAQGSKDDADATQSLPEEEKEQIRDQFEASMKEMSASQLQSIIDDPSAVKMGYEVYYADDEGKGKVAKWASDLVKLARQLLPNAPADPQPASDEEMARMFAEGREQQRTHSRGEREAARDQGPAKADENAPTEEDAFQTMRDVAKKINEYGNKVLELSANMEAERAGIREGAKYVAGELRIMIGSGLEGVPPPKLDEATQGIRAVEAAFALIANGKFDAIPADLPDLATIARRSGLAIDASLIERAQSLLRRARALDPLGPEYDPRPEWAEMVDRNGNLAQKMRNPLLAYLESVRTTNPRYEKMRIRMDNVLYLPAPELRFSLRALEPLRVGAKPFGEE